MALSIFSLMGSIFVDSSEAENSISKTEEKSNKLADSFINGISTAGKWAAGIATAAASAAVAVGTAAINVSTDVDTAMNDFAASTGTAVEELGKYEDAMLNIYKANYGESFEDIAASMGEVKRIMGEGMGAEELEAMTTNALMLRDTFDFEVSESVRAANSLMDQFGISGEEAYNLIAQGAQSGLNQNGDMLDVLNEYGVQFSQMGYSAEDMFNMLANGAESGTWSIDKLGDAAKEFNIRMQDGTANKAIEKLGLNVAEVNKKYAAGGKEAQGATQEILAALQSVEDENERYILGQQLMGTMWEDLGEDAILAMSDTEGAISNTKDALTEINDIKYDDLGSMIEGLKRNFETLLLPLGNALIPIIMQFVQLIQDNMPMIESLFAQVTPVIAQLFESLIPPLMQLISTLLPPIMQIVSTVLPLVSSLISALMPLFTQIIEAILPVFLNLINMLLPPILQIVNMVLPILIQLITPILSLLQPIINLLSPLIELCMALITPLVELLGAVLPPLIEIIVYLAEVVLAQWQKQFENVTSVITNVVNIAVAFVQNQIAIMQSVFSDIISFLQNVFTGNWSAAFENVKNILTNVFNNIITFLQNVFTVNWTAAFENVKTILTNVFNNIITFLQNVFTVNWSAAFNNVKNILTNILTNITDFISNVFTGNWSAAFENVKNILSNIFNGMIDIVRNPVNTIIGIINGMISGVTSGVNSVIDVLNGLQVDVPDWVTKATGVTSFGFDISHVDTPEIPYLAGGGTAIEGGSAIVGEAGAELINLPQGARVTPLTNNGDPIGYKEMASKLDVMIDLLAAILQKEGVVHIGESQFVDYMNKSLGALL